jgi:hypothetical protein
VHAKLMLVDDVFLGVGSANLNRRGLFYDGEVQCFAVPEALRAGPQNPVLALRRRLWAEMLDLPPGAAGALLDEPVAASALFRRSPFQGNRYVPIEGLPDHFMFGWSTGDGAVGTVLAGLGFTLIAGNEDVFYRFVVDPTSRLDPAP